MVRHELQPPEAVDLFSLAGTLTSFERQGIDARATLRERLRRARVDDDPENPFSGREAFVFSRLTRVEGEPVLLALDVTAESVRVGNRVQHATVREGTALEGALPVPVVAIDERPPPVGEEVDLLRELMEDAHVEALGEVHLDADVQVVQAGHAHRQIEVSAEVEARLAECERLVGRLYAENAFLKKVCAVLEAKAAEDRKCR